jgi:hypothetical protein
MQGITLYEQRGIRLFRDEEGEIRLQVGTTYDGVMVDSFVKRLTSDQARLMADALVNAAESNEKGEHVE